MHVYVHAHVHVHIIICTFFVSSAAQLGNHASSNSGSHRLTQLGLPRGPAREKREVLERVRRIRRQTQDEGKWLLCRHLSSAPVISL